LGAELTGAGATATMLGSWCTDHKKTEDPMVAAVGSVTADTAAVRVTRWTFDVGAGTGRHRHEHDYVVVPVTGGAFAVTDAQGGVSTMQQVAGDPYLGSAGTTHDVVNATDRQVSFVEIEVKS
jgi:quercetin dioxygenase-like cupin family protein